MKQTLLDTNEQTGLDTSVSHQYRDYQDKNCQQEDFRVELHHRYNGLNSSYRMLHPTTVQYTFFSAANIMLSKTDYI
jgi:hypothetical protein